MTTPAVLVHVRQSILRKRAELTILHLEHNCTLADISDWPGFIKEPPLFWTRNTSPNYYLEELCYLFVIQPIKVSYPPIKCRIRHSLLAKDITIIQKKTRLTQEGGEEAHTMHKQSDQRKVFIKTCQWHEGFYIIVILAFGLLLG